MAGFNIIEGDVFVHDKDGNGISSETLDEKQLLHVLAVQEFKSLDLARKTSASLSNIEDLLSEMISLLSTITSE